MPGDWTLLGALPSSPREWDWVGWRRKFYWGSLTGGGSLTPIWPIGVAVFLFYSYWTGLQISGHFRSIWSIPWREIEWDGASLGRLCPTSNPESLPSWTSQEFGISDLVESSLLVSIIIWCSEGALTSRCWGRTEILRSNSKSETTFRFLED